MGIIRYLIDRKIIFDNKNLKKTTIKYKNLITDLAIKDILLFGKTKNALKVARELEQISIIEAAKMYIEIMKIIKTFDGYYISKIKNLIEILLDNSDETIFNKEINFLYISFASVIINEGKKGMKDINLLMKKIFKNHPYNIGDLYEKIISNGNTKLIEMINQEIFNDIQKLEISKKIKLGYIYLIKETLDPALIKFLYKKLFISVIDKYQYLNNKISPS